MCECQVGGQVTFGEAGQLRRLLIGSYDIMLAWARSLLDLARSTSLSSDLEPCPQLVDDEGGQRLALHVLGDDQQRPLGLDNLLEDREQGLQPGEGVGGMGGM